MLVFFFFPSIGMSWIMPQIVFVLCLQLKITSSLKRKKILWDPSLFAYYGSFGSSGIVGFFFFQTKV